MSDPLRERLDAAAPAVAKIKADLPPSTTVFLSCETAVDYNDEYYFWAGDGECYTVTGVFASRADAEAMAAKSVLHCGDEVLEEVVNDPASYPDFTHGVDGWYWHTGFVKEMEIQ